MKVSAEGRMIFSVIVPTAGRPRELARLLESLRGQIFEGTFEVILVNDSELARSWMTDQKGI